MDTQTDTTAPDFAIRFGGTVSLFVPLTNAAAEWLAEHCPDCADHQYLGRNLAVEARYLDDLIQFAVGDGLTPPASLRRS